MATTRQKLCNSCQMDIDAERLEVLPNTCFCARCSTEQPVVGFMIYEHKTAGYVQFVQPDNYEALRQAKRANRRAR